MSDSTLETVLRRDRLIVAGALGVIVALAWVYLLWLAADDSLDAVVQTMEKHQIRRVPVVDDRDSCVGIIAQGKLVADGIARDLLRSTGSGSIGEAFARLGGAAAFGEPPR